VLWTCALVPSNLLHNLPFLLRGYHGRLSWIQAGHTSKSIASCLELGHRLTDVSVLCALMFLSDLLNNVIKPFARVVQKHLEPSIFERALERNLRDAVRQKQSLMRMRVFFRVFACLRQHVPLSGLQSLLRAYSFTVDGMRFPTFFAEAKTLLASGKPTIRGCALDIVEASDSKTTKCWGPHCQCPGKVMKGAVSVGTAIKWNRSVLRAVARCPSYALSARSAALRKVKTQKELQECSFVDVGARISLEEVSIAPRRSPAKISTRGSASCLVWEVSGSYIYIYIYI